jgi:hypothetical protein
MHHSLSYHPKCRLRLSVIEDQRTVAETVSATGCLQDRDLTPRNHGQSSNSAQKTIFLFYIKDLVAEREGFEPPVRLPVLRISSAARSTTLPPLQAVDFIDFVCTVALRSSLSVPKATIKPPKSLPSRPSNTTREPRCGRRGGAGSPVDSRTDERWQALEHVPETRLQRPCQERSEPLAPVLLLRRSALECPTCWQPTTDACCASTSSYTTA